MEETGGRKSSQLDWGGWVDSVSIVDKEGVEVQSEKVEYRWPPEFGVECIGSTK